MYCRPSFTLANGCPNDPSLPNGTQSASAMKPVLSGLPVRLPLIAPGAYAIASAEPQIFFTPSEAP